MLFLDDSITSNMIGFSGINKVLWLGPQYCVWNLDSICMRTCFTCLLPVKAALTVLCLHFIHSLLSMCAFIFDILYRNYNSSWPKWWFSTEQLHSTVVNKWTEVYVFFPECHNCNLPTNLFLQFELFQKNCLCFIFNLSYFFISSYSTRKSSNSAFTNYHLSKNDSVVKCQSCRCH